MYTVSYSCYSLVYICYVCCFQDPVIGVLVEQPEHVLSIPSLFRNNKAFCILLSLNLSVIISEPDLLHRLSGKADTPQGYQERHADIVLRDRQPARASQPVQRSSLHLQRSQRQPRRRISVRPQSVRTGLPAGTQRLLQGRQCVP